MSRNSRESEARDHDLRPSYPTHYASVLESIAAQVKRPGEKLRWVNYAIRNEPTYNVENALWEHWTIVEKDRLPHYTGDTFGRNPISDKGIVYKDVILMRCDDESYKIKEREHHDKCKKTIKSLRGVVDDHGSNYNGNQIHSF